MLPTLIVVRRAVKSGGVGRLAAASTSLSESLSASTPLRRIDTSSEISELVST
jgi:hypothetical protein